MRDSKLCKWLSRLDKGEQNAFLRYVQALGGKNREELHRVAKLFVKKVVRGSKNMSREEFYLSMGWSPPYNPGHLHSRLTDLKKKLEAFLAIQELRKNPVAVTAYHLQAIAARGWTDLARAEVKQARDTVEEAAVDVERYRYQLQIEESYLIAAIESPRKFKEPSFQEPMRLLEQYFCLQKLRFACAALSQDRMMNLQHDYGMVEAVLDAVRARLADAPPVLRMYYHTYHMIASPDDSSHFHTLRAEIERHWVELDRELAQEFYKHLLNYCSLRINAGFPEFVEELSGIYEQTMDTGVLLVDGRMDPGQLKNIIGMMIRTGKMEVAERLLATYGPKLTADADPVTTDFLSALILYYQGQYSMTRKLMEIVQRDAEDIFFKLQAKLYSMRASYELGDLDLSEDNYNALRMYLKRDKLLPRASRENYLEFINLLNRLWTIQQEAWPRDKRRRKLQALEAKASEAPSNNNILWLREKVAEELRRL